MQAFPDIARGMFKGSKEESNRFWRNLEMELNASGPPTKSVSEWKKVWCDQKRYVRQKAAQNLKLSKLTGGGPNMEKTFTANEEAIYNLIGMKESVEGIANTFGLGSSSTSKKADESIEAALTEILAEDLENEVQPPSQPPAKKLKKTPIEQAARISPADILTEEICIQKNILQTMKEHNEITKKIYRSIDRLYDLKKEEIKEQRRHNLVMEQLRLTEVEGKIEKTKKIIEIENLKTKH